MWPEFRYALEGEEQMSPGDFDPELERRIAVYERETHHGSGFTAADWAWLALLGIVGPALLLAWGWLA